MSKVSLIQLKRAVSTVSMVEGKKVISFTGGTSFLGEVSLKYGLKPEYLSFLLLINLSLEYQ